MMSDPSIENELNTDADISAQITEILQLQSFNNLPNYDVFSNNLEIYLHVAKPTDCSISKFKAKVSDFAPFNHSSFCIVDGALKFQPRFPIRRKPIQCECCCISRAFFRHDPTRQHIHVPLRDPCTTVDGPLTCPPTIWQSALLH